MTRTFVLAILAVAALNSCSRNEPSPANRSDSHCLQKAENDKAKAVVKACEKHWEANKADCNKFLKATATELGIKELNDKGDANGIINYLETMPTPSPWAKLGRGDHLGAHTKAKDGYFVVAGLLGSDMGTVNGHVAVTTCGDMEHSASDDMDFPRGYWGKLDGVGDQCKGLNYSFPSPPRKTLRYYYRSVP